MRISDWSSDVCSSDLFFAVVIKLTGVDRQRLPGVLLQQIQAQGGFQPTFFHRQLEVDNCQIGSASCRDRVGQYVLLSVVAVSLKKTLINTLSISENPP